MATQEIPHSGDSQLWVSHQGVNLQPITGAEDGSLKHLVMAPKGLERGLDGLLRDAELFTDFDRCRAMTEADDGNMHGDGPLIQTSTFSSGRCSERRP